MQMRLRMLKHCVGKGRHVMKQLHVCLRVLQYYIRYSGYRAHGVCALQSSSFMECGEREGELERGGRGKREVPQIVFICFFLLAPDGCNELYVGLTDRSVVLYRWAEEGRSLQAMKSFKLPGQVQI